MRNGRRVIFALVIAGFATACAAPVKVPVQSGPYSVEHADVTLATEHAGALALHVSYPANARGDFPLVVFSHGHYLTNDAYDELTDRWVEQGFVVVAPQHIDTGDREYVTQLAKKVGQDWIAAARILDIRAVLDQMQTVADSLAAFQGKVSTREVIAAGHSLGALSAQLVAGATLEKQNDSLYPLPDVLRDERVVAVVAVSPPGEMPGYLTQATWQHFNAPQLVVTGTQDVFAYIWQDYRAHFVSYLSAQPGDNFLLVLDGMDHYMGGLIGRLDRDGPRQRQARDQVARISGLFMRRYLSGERQSAAAQSLIDDMAVAHDGIVRYEQR